MVRFASCNYIVQPVTTRATTATRAGCVRHGVGHAQPNILQLKTEGLTANTISVIE